MTLSGYSKQVKSGGMAGLVRLWTGAGLWVVAMIMMTSPAMQQVEARVAKLGTAAGYWDPMFTGKAAGGLLMASSFAIFGIVATMRWLISALIFSLKPLNAPV